MSFENYLNTIGITESATKAEGGQLNQFVNSWFKKTPPKLTSAEVDALYRYRVPKLGEGGACSITDEFEDKPYNLAETFQLNGELLEQHPATLRLWRLNGIVDNLYLATKADWLGIYRSIDTPTADCVLVKEAYRGAPSRAEFPLNKEFAKSSNNSTVGLTGKAVLFQDIETYEGPYYKCDAKVQSEFCIPILNPKGKVTGIIDAESFQKRFFSSEKVLQIAKVCMDLGITDESFSQ